MKLKELKEKIRTLFTIDEVCNDDEMEKALHQMLAMIEEEEYRRKIDAMMGGGR